MDTPIQQYRAKLRSVIDYGGSLNETTIRAPFIDLVNAFAEGRGLLLVPELEYRTAAGTAVYPDGTLKDRFRLSYGYYEAKDPKDDLDREIEDKTRKNYPLINTIFENSRVAVLYQNQREAMRIDMADDAALKALITAFVDFEREEIYEFHAALAQFKTDLSALVAWCRDEINAAKDNAEFARKVDVFLKKCRDEINPDFSFKLKKPLPGAVVMYRRLCHNAGRRAKMAKWKKAAHVVYQCRYHLVWTPKHRYRILTGEIKEYVDEEDNARLHSPGSDNTAKDVSI